MCACMHAKTRTQHTCMHTHTYAHTHTHTHTQVEYGPPGGAAVVAAAAETGKDTIGTGPAGGSGSLLARRRLARHYLAMAASQLDTLLGKAWPVPDTPRTTPYARTYIAHTMFGI